MAKKIKMLKPGKFRDMKGIEINLTAEDLAATAAAYDPNLYAAPMVIGHPQVNHPAYGKVVGVDFSAGFLNGEPGQVDPNFEQVVNGGYYDRVSLSLFSPTSPANPKPGVWYPRHLGFLGAAAPAVPGLGTVSFAENDEGVINLSIDLGSWNDRTIARMFRNVKNFMIEKFGKEEADKVLDEWDLETITEEALRPEPPVEIQSEPAFAEHKQGGGNMLTAEQIAALEAENATLKTALKANVTGAAHAANVAFAEGLVKDGKVVAANKAAVIAVLDFAAGVIEGDTIEFGEGDAKQAKPPVDILQDLFASGPKIIDFAELGGHEGPGVEDTGKIPADLAKHV